MPFPAKVKRCTESLQSLFSLYLLYLFVEVYAILVLRFIRPSYLGREVYLMIHILTIFGVCRSRCNVALHLASGLTDSTRTASPTKRKAPGEVATPWGLFFLVYRMEYPHNSIFSICHSPQKSSVAQKVYKPAAFILQVPHIRACCAPSASAKRPAHRHLLRPAWHPPD